MLSVFESALLDRHLRRCAGCRDFADTAAAHTALLRSALPEEPTRRVVVPSGRQTARRRSLVGAAFVTAVSAAAAIVTLVPGAHRSTHTSRVSVRNEGPVLVVFPAKPTPDGKVEVPRLKVQPASIADGPVRGAYFTRPSV
jgi:hypothetical protein